MAITRFGSIPENSLTVTCSFLSKTVSFIGIEISKELPSPCILETEIFPPSKFIKPLVIESPSPNPSAEISVADLSKGVNIRSIVFLLIPIPVS